MRHTPQPCSAAIALGSYDIGVATQAVELFRKHLFPVVVFSGATSAVTVDRFPRGEAIHYREHALNLGLPESAILIEPMATNTGQNIKLSRKALETAGVVVNSLMLISMRYMERRAFATCSKQWPEIPIVCASAPLTYVEYVKTIGNEKLVIDELVGDLQRIMEYPKLGFATEQEIPAKVGDSYCRLLQDGFDNRLLALPK
ncbi:YdcF family protein [Umezawaea sp. Da 62-37]|nr:YdcF family protein [Umezawaea sp. Da 62-37]WNV92098.1 YdcF family protein [Umezawaea sp. Da 62-37]